MPIAIGSHLGPYEIVASLGAGGMGEVYRARDPRIGRDGNTYAYSSMRSLSDLYLVNGLL